MKAKGLVAQVLDVGRDPAMLSFLHTKGLEPPALFVFTHAREKADGTRGTETEGVFRLEEIDGGTRLVFTQGPFDTAEHRDTHGSGWRESFDRLAEHLRRTAGSAGDL